MLEIPADCKVDERQSLTIVCRKIVPGFLLQAKQWPPRVSISIPHLQVWAENIGVPRRKAMELRNSTLLRKIPQHWFGVALSQSPEF